MKYCINPNCSEPENPDGELFCLSCSSQLLLAGRYWGVKLLRTRTIDDEGHVCWTFEASEQGARRILKTFQGNDPWLLSRFRREAEILCQLRHPGLPRVEPEGFFRFTPKDSSETLHCLVMELIDGINLLEWLEKRGNRPIGQDEERIALDWLQQLADILAHVHDRGFFHRDVKPSNIMLSCRGPLVLIDFGEARDLTPEDVTTVYTKGYAAPEQYKGGADLRSDWFGLGRTFVHLLTGTDPNELVDPQTGALIWRDKTTVSEALQDLVDELMAPSPDHRPENGQQILSRLEIIGKRLPKLPAPARVLEEPDSSGAGSSGSPSSGSPSSRARNGSSGAGSKAPNRPGVARSGIAAAAALALFAGGIYYAVNRPEQKKEPDSPVEQVENVMDKAMDKDSCPTQTEDNLSCGEEILLTSRLNPSAKKEGVKAFAKGKYDRAAELLYKARQKDPSDPEIAIYLNNARIAKEAAYTIAVVVPIADSTSSAEEVLRGVAQAQDEINKNNQGIRLRVLIADDGNDKTQAKNIADRIAVAANVIATIGHFSSSVTEAVADRYKERGLVLISPTSTSVYLSELGENNQFFFRTVQSDRVTAQALVEYLKKNQHGKAAVFYNAGADYSLSLRNEFGSRFRGELEVAEEFDWYSPAFDLNTYLGYMRQYGDIAMVLLPDSSTRTAAIEAISQAKSEGYAIVGGDSLYIPELKRDIAEKVVVAVPWESGCHKTSDFYKGAAKLWQTLDMSWRAALAYDAVAVVTAALEQQPQSRFELQQTLLEKDFQASGATGLIEFEDNGDRSNGAIELVQVTKQSDESYDFQPIQCSPANN
ncbi:MAG: ABC transporter substrate-binding protein [Oscillatoria sp. SIO1A7]|nr:ABC transporter substrate-binding protein [Oscillatoria sp. SIO1A7]